MDTSKYPQSDASLLLLNEIEILLTQIHLTELYVKQAQSTAANEAARIQNQHETELSALKLALAQNEQLLASRQQIAGATEKKLLERAQNLEQQANETQRLFDEREALLEHARAEVAALRERIARLQAAKEEAEAKVQTGIRERQELQSAFAALRQELEVNQRDFEHQQLVSRALQENLQAQLDQLRVQLAEREAWAGSVVALQQARSEIAALHGRLEEQRLRFDDSIAEVERSRTEIALAQAAKAEAEQARRELDARLHAKEEDVRAAQAGAEAVKSHFEAKLSALQIQLAERHLLADGRAAEIENLNAKIGRLSEQAAAGQSAAEELSARVHAESEAAHQAEIAALRQEHREFQRRLEEQNAGLMGHIQEQQAQWTAVQSEQQVRQEYAERIKELKAEVQAQAEALHQRETAFSQLEQTLRAEIERLIDEAQEKHLLLQNRNDELVRSKSERDALQGKNRDLAATSARIEAAMSAEAERMRTEFQAQLAFLQAELSQKEWALEEKHAAGGGKDQQYREQIELLSRQLAEAEPRKQPEKPGIGDDALTEEQEERYAKLREVADAVTPRPDPSFPALENRRWRTQMGWKRRWK
jgi:chromosome segregation ATPase